MAALAGCLPGSAPVSAIPGDHGGWNGCEQRRQDRGRNSNPSTANRYATTDQTKLGEVDLKLLGEPRTPFTLVVDRTGKVLLAHHGIIKDIDRFFDTVKESAK